MTDGECLSADTPVSVAGHVLPKDRSVLRVPVVRPEHNCVFDHDSVIELPIRDCPKGGSSAMDHVTPIGVSMRYGSADCRKAHPAPSTYREATVACEATVFVDV